MGLKSLNFFCFVFFFVLNIKSKPKKPTIRNNHVNKKKKKRKIKSLPATEARYPNKSKYTKIGGENENMYSSF